MKKAFSILIVLAAVACVHELPAPKDNGGTGGTTGGGGTIQLRTCSKDTVYLTNTILPLINSLCGKSGCHGTSNRNAFQLTTWDNIVPYLGTRGRISESLNGMADQLNENPTLNYTPPTSDQLATLQKWADQGGLNNYCNSCDSTQFAFAANVSPIISTYCAGCHSGSSPSAGIDLGSYTAIVAEVNGHPGRLLGSIQWTTGYSGTKQMPQGPTGKLPKCYIAQIRQWIDANMPNN